MTTAQCPLCNEKNGKRQFAERGHDLLQCPKCELFYISPYGTSEEVHKQTAHHNYKNLKVVDPKAQHAASKSYFENKYLAYINKELGPGEKSILDVGCGSAALLELLSKKRPEVKRVGIELNSKRAQVAAKLANCEVFETPVESFSYPQQFDVITMMNVLSHIPSLDDLFSSLRNLLTAEGKLILKVGEMTSSVKKDAINDWGIPNHLHFLGMNTLDFICEKYGFDVVTHQRQTLSEDMFARHMLLTPGRSKLRDFVKKTIAYTPFALTIVRKIYDTRHKQDLFSTYAVLTPRP